MIDRTHPLSVLRQCQLLKLARSTASYQPQPVSEPTLALMRRIDALHRHYPVAGARMLCALFRQEGHAIGRRQVPLPGCAGWEERRCIGARTFAVIAAFLRKNRASATSAVSSSVKATAV
ncbi:MAG: hypothetical protein LDL14_11475, partial [Nitrospira sp.]|nr:hypothetical protein [Nitrospira sp.]